MGEGTRRSGAWVVCQPGCTQCCLGPFAITPLDALQLREGLRQLRETDPARAARVERRAREYVELAATRSGAPCAPDALPDAMDDVPCPVLDPRTGWCDLYEARPITCRTFGPAVLGADGEVSVCELCYQGASDEEIARCAVVVDPDDREGETLRQMEGGAGPQLVALALVG